MAGEGRLGCLQTIEIIVTGKCGAARLLSLDNAIDVSWDRRLDDISAATVNIALGGGLGPDACCEQIGNVEPWCHELHIFRNGEEVWTGVITEVSYSATRVTIEARDVLAWLQVRIPECPFSVTTLTDISTIAQTIIKLALADEDPCVFDNMLVVPARQIGPNGQELGVMQLSEPFPAFESTAYEQLASMTQYGLSYTVLGRRIVVGGENLFNKKIGMLTDEHILGDYSIIKDGSLYVNRAFTRYFEDDDPARCAANEATGVCLPPLAGAACPAVSEIAPENRACYGLVERVVSVGDGINFNTAKQAGDIYVAAGGKYVPRILEFPSGTSLSPETPFEINDLVPGMNIFLGLRALCFGVDPTQEWKLTGMNYEATAEGESISISLTSRNLITGGLESVS